jgi:S-DNA-T family DNA segregation ATPase FtsK/SpoIIIE
MRAGVKDFVLNGKDALVANWCGRLGAALSHLLVYRGAGIASLAIGLWGLSMGLHIVYGKRMAATMRYLRWTCLIMLTAAPILAYVFPHSSFPWGGALGSEAVAYSNGFIGQAGTGLVLLGLAVFVLFVIFALDVTPMIRRARRAAQKMRERMAEMRTGDDEEDFIAEGEQPAKKKAAPVVSEDVEPFTGLGNKGMDEMGQLDDIEETPSKSKTYAMSTLEKEAAMQPAAQAMLADGLEEEDETEVVDDEELAFQKFQEEETARKAAKAVQPKPAKQEEKPQFSFEVVQQAEKPAASNIKKCGNI